MGGTLRSVVVGCRRGASHAKPMAVLEEYELVGVCDLSEEEAKNLAAETGNPEVFTDYAEMLEKTKPDVVAVAVPTAVHAEYTLMAAEAGVKGINCEKPLARNLSEAREIIKKCKEKNIPLIFEHQRRLNNPFLTMKSLIDNGAIGEVYLIRANCAGQVITDGTHSMDLIFHLAGDPEPEWVLGQIHRLPPDPDEPQSKGGKVSGGYRYGHPIETGAMAVIQFKNGLRAELLTGDIRVPGRRYQDIEVFGSSGRLWRASDGAEPPVQIQDAGAGSWREAPLDSNEFKEMDADTRSYKLFADTIHNGTPHPLNGDNALAMFQVLMGIYESARLNKKIELPFGQDRFPLEIMIEEGRA